MRLPPFLRYLGVGRAGAADLALNHSRPDEGFALQGHLRVERQARGGPLELVHDSPNFIVDAGMTAVRNMLLGDAGVAAGGFLGSLHRMALGGQGVPAGELFNPKLPDSTWPARTTLFHEIIRQDITAFTSPTDFSARFASSFNSLDMVGHEASYPWTDRVVNEAALIIGDGVLTVGGDKKYLNDGDSADSDEVMFSMRTFNSASFDSGEDITITVTWTITVTTTN